MTRRCRLLLWGLLAAAPWPAWGQSCTVTATAAAFGTYSYTGPAVTSTATITVTCSALVAIGVNYNISLGSGGSGSVAARGMAGTGPRLPYQLYRDSGLTQIWGDGTGGSFIVNDGYLLGVVFPVIRNYTAYGRIPAGNQVPVGGYTDSITVLVSY